MFVRGPQAPEMGTSASFKYELDGFVGAESPADYHQRHKASVATPAGSCRCQYQKPLHMLWISREWWSKTSQFISVSLTGLRCTVSRTVCKELSHSCLENTGKTSDRRLHLEETGLESFSSSNIHACNLSPFQSLSSAYFLLGFHRVSAVKHDI